MPAHDGVDRRLVSHRVSANFCEHFLVDRESDVFHAASSSHNICVLVFRFHLLPKVLSVRCISELYSRSSSRTVNALAALPVLSVAAGSNIKTTDSGERERGR